ncbi:MAG TPA: hypothetical protein VKA84_25730 [Gemmatimonadaceae bacterium]|nr:hypothetical protein [Gemmatimonadaceae bacterium]
MANEQERREPQGKKPVSINDLPESASAGDGEAVKGGLLPRAGDGGTWTDPTDDEEIGSGE